MAIVGDAYVVVHAITVDFESEIRAALDRLRADLDKWGGDAGKNLSKNFNRNTKGMFSNWMKESEGAKNAFNSLIRTSYMMGPAISGVVSSISDLVFGLVSMGAAVGAALPSLVILPGILASIGMAGITAKLAFGGIGKALGALSKQKTAGNGGENTKAIENARERLAMAYQSAAEKMAAANDKVRKAQIALNLAYKQGAESLQQLGFDAEDAVLAQQKAAIELERARETLMRSQDLPVNDRGRREAELGFKEAELNYRRQTDKVNDLKVATDYANKTGIEGTKEVMGAKKDLAESEKDRAKTERDNAQEISRAQRQVAAAIANSAKSARAVTNAFKDLSPEAAKFAKYLFSLKPIMKQLKAAAGEELFGPLTTALKILVKDLVPALIPIFKAMGGVIGKVALSFAKMLSQVVKAGVFKRFFGGTALKVVEDLGGAFVALAEAAFYILDAAGPLIKEFTSWVKITADAWSNTMQLKNGTGELGGTFSKAGGAAKRILGALKSLFGGFKAFAGAGTEAGLDLFDSLGKAGESLRKFAEAGKKSGELQKKFGQIGKNVKAMGGFLGEVVKALFDLAGNKGVEDFWKALMPLPKIFSGIMKNLTGSGKTIGTFIVHLGEMISKFTETGGIENFFKILDKAVKVVTAIFSNKTVMHVFMFLAAMHGVLLAFGTLGKVGKLALQVVTGKFLGMGKAMSLLNPAALGKQFSLMGDKAFNAAGKLEAFRTSGGMGGMFKTLKSGLGDLGAGFSLLGAEIWVAMAPLLPWIALGVAIAAIFYLMWKNSKILRDSLGTLVSAVGGAFKDSFADINKVIHEVMPQFKGLNDVFKAMGDFVGTYIVPIFQFVLVNAIHTVKDVIVLVIRIIKGLFDLITDPMKGLKEIWSAFGKFFGSRIVGIFKDASAALSKIPLFKSIIDGAKTAFNFVVRFWNSTIGKLDFHIPDWIPGIGGKGFKFPTLKEITLARGGIVQPRAGGVRAVIAEAGRAERVEPLDANGLSVRDKALIAQMVVEMTGGRGGQSGINMTINPSPGMDERELAALVNRRLASTMLRGA
jgi:hypothetical protein